MRDLFPHASLKYVETSGMASDGSLNIDSCSDDEA